MRDTERLRKTQRWFYDELCKGRQYKVPKGNNILNVDTAEPRVFLAYQPLRPDYYGNPTNLSPTPVFEDDPYSTCPSITIMPGPGYLQYMQDKRFDNYKNIYRPKKMGQTLSTTNLFAIYEPGIRMPGFVESMESGTPDMSLLKDGSEAGLLTLMDWMNDAKELVLREQHVPGTDMILDKDSAIESLFSDQNYIVDRRPIYYGFLLITWNCHADTGNDHGKPTKADRLLDGNE
ncbi:MAG: hypothetical protein IKN04_08745 [Clostridia bacterium]|nr:hypothetical protein [Clostridia bacterium]